MSENLDLVRSICSDWERGDFAAVKWADPKIEFVFADGPEPGSWEGQAPMAEAWRKVLSLWTDVHTEVAEHRELDDQRVLVLMSWSGRGKASGFDLARAPWRGANLFHLHKRKVTRLVLYWDRANAFADLGLEE
jgi:hypothetical protein